MIFNWNKVKMYLSCDRVKKKSGTRNVRMISKLPCVIVKFKKKIFSRSI